MKDKLKMQIWRNAYLRLKEIMYTPEHKSHSELFKLKKELRECQRSREGYKKQYNKWENTSRLLAEKLSDKNRITLCPPGDYISTCAECVNCKDKENKRVNCWLEWARNGVECAKDKNDR